MSKRNELGELAMSKLRYHLKRVNATYLFGNVVAGAARMSLAEDEGALEALETEFRADLDEYTRDDDGDGETEQKSAKETKKKGTPASGNGSGPGKGRKECAECGKTKGVKAFEKGSPTCKECAGVEAPEKTPRGKQIQCLGCGQLKGATAFKKGDPERLCTKCRKARESKAAAGKKHKI